MNSICTTFEARTTWGISSTEPVAPAILTTTPMDIARFGCRSIMGHFGAAFVCTIVLDYLFDADGLSLKDSEDKTLITE